MTRLAGLPYNFGGLIAAEAHSNKAATSAIPRVVAGSNRLYYELVTGKIIEGSPQCSPRRPCGGAGHDHTGGYMGKAFVHTVFAAAYPGADLDSRTLPPTTSRAGGSSTPHEFCTIEYNVPIPACETNGAYTKLRCDIVTNCTTYNSTTAVGGVIYTSATGFASGKAWESDVASAGFDSANVNVPFLPGQHNLVRLTMRITEAIATVVELVSFSISQTT